MRTELIIVGDSLLNQIFFIKIWVLGGKLSMFKNIFSLLKIDTMLKPKQFLEVNLGRYKNLVGHMYIFQLDI